MGFVILPPATVTEGLRERAALLTTNRASAALGGSAALPLDLRAITAEAFGYSPLRRFQVEAELTDTAPTNMFGLPVFCQVNLHAARNPVTLDQANGLALLDPLVTVDAPMRVEKTPVLGRKGTVKEFISQGDYGVVIRAILATDVHAANRYAYPLPQVQKLRALCELGVALSVSGWLLDVYNIKSLVVENVRYESLPGFTNLQAYELQCVSDDPIELIF